MNRTAMFLGLAAVLSLLAVVLGLPGRLSGGSGGGAGGGGSTTLTPPPAVVKDGAIRMEGRLSHPYVLAGQSDVFVTVDLTGKDVPGAARGPVNLAVVIDRSGSMSGQKLSEAKQAARHLVQQLRDQDRLAIVHYGSDVQRLPSMLATAANRERMLQYIDGIFDDGGTNIGDGLGAGRDQLLEAIRSFKVNRIVLISDGQPTEGLTDPHALRNVVREIRTHGVSVSSIGVGTDFNEDLMQAFAELGGGSYAYLRDATQLASIFQRDLQQATTLVARAVTLSFELPDGVELGEVLGYRAAQSGRTVSVALPDFGARQLERVVARLVVRGKQAGQTLDVTRLGLAYQDLLEDRAATADARLSALVTDRTEEVARNQDATATVYATRAQTARNTWEAAESLKRGDRVRARELISQNAQILESAAQVAGPAAVAADVGAQTALMREVDEAKTEEQIQHQVKSTKRKAMKDYGRVGSTY